MDSIVSVLHSRDIDPMFPISDLYNFESLSLLHGTPRTWTWRLLTINCYNHRESTHFNLEKTFVTLLPFYLRRRWPVLMVTVLILLNCPNESFFFLYLSVFFCPSPYMEERGCLNVLKRSRVITVSDWFSVDLLFLNQRSKVRGCNS